MILLNISLLFVNNNHYYDIGLIFQISNEYNILDIANGCIVFLDGCLFC